jgi:hypothetical protein
MSSEKGEKIFRLGQFFIGVRLSVEVNGRTVTNESSDIFLVFCGISGN